MAFHTAANKSHAHLTPVHTPLARIVLPAFGPAVVFPPSDGKTFAVRRDEREQADRPATGKGEPVGPRRALVTTMGTDARGIRAVPANMQASLLASKQAALLTSHLACQLAVMLVS